MNSPLCAADCFRKLTDSYPKAPTSLFPVIILGPYIYTTVDRACFETCITVELLDGSRIHLNEVNECLTGGWLHSPDCCGTPKHL